MSTAASSSKSPRFKDCDLVGPTPVSPLPSRAPSVLSFANAWPVDSVGQMADRILIQNLQLRCLIGIHPEERESAQDLRIHLVLHTDIRKAAASDSIVDAVDYQSVTEKIVSFTEQSRRLLLETLIEDMAQLILSSFPAVDSLQLRVEKPAALPLADFAGIEIERSRVNH